jgi:hypothetical protein
MRWVPFAVLLAAVALLVSSAEARAVPSKAPWATVNVCDTAKKRNSVGIRAGMPGNGTEQRMYMRFQLQWYRPKERRYMDTGTPSGWVSAGSARFRAAQRGFTFAGIADPPAGGTYKLRGKVSFEWRELVPAKPGVTRKHERVVRHAQRITRGGLKGVEGGKRSASALKPTPSRDREHQVYGLGLTCPPRYSDPSLVRA